jgi:diguanylate cyclase (GGDEF)-like protein
MTSEAAVQRLITLVKMLEQQSFYDAEEQLIQVSLSAGIAQYPQDGSDLRSLYRSADTALQQAKQRLTDFAIATYQ